MAQSKRLVIDACVAQGSGPPESTHPRATHCREFLLAVLRICYRMIETNEIIEEWKKHESNFARSWRVSMHSKRKIVTLDLRQDATLRTLIEEHAPDDAILKIILKDVHLIEAALGSDCRIVSVETKAFKHLRKLADHLPEIARLALVNPEDPAHDASQWLKDGAPISGVHRLLRKTAKG